MILYNGASGGLGRHMAGAMLAAGCPGHAIEARLEDSSGQRAALERIRPSEDATFVHLAAKVSVPACELDPAGARATNVDGAVRAATEFLEWAGRHRVSARMVYVSTGHVYARQRPGSGIKEDAMLAPRSVYASTKLEAERVLSEMAEARGVSLVIARVFGLLGPCQPPQYVLPGLIRRVLEHDIEDVPGLDNVRDYLDTRDVCAALVALSQLRAMPDLSVVNVCAGEGVSIRTLMSMVAEALNGPILASDVHGASAALSRPDDVPWMVGDPSRFTALTGRKPRIRNLRTTVRDAIAPIVERSA